MNLFNVYEAALQNAVSNDVVFNVEYIIDYVDNVFDAYIPAFLAQKIVDAHDSWLNSERGRHNYYVLVQAQLEDYTIIV